MTSTHFTTGTTITSEWLNDVNDAVYEGNITAEGVQYTPPFTGGVTETVEAKLAQTVSVKDFGAVGDGVTDDTQAIQDADTAASADGKTLFFPDGIYCVSPNGIFMGGASWLGSSRDKSILRAKAVSFSNLSGLVSCQNKDSFTISRLGFDLSTGVFPAGSGNPGNIYWGLSIQLCVGWSVSDCLFTGIQAQCQGLAVDAGADFEIIDNLFYMPVPSGAYNQSCNISYASGVPTGYVFSRNILNGSGLFSNGARGLIANNYVKGWKFGGGLTFGPNAGSSVNTVQGNIVVGQPTSQDINSVWPTGIECWSPYSIIIGNHVENCSGDGIGTGGFAIQIIGNKCLNNGRGNGTTTGVGSGISINSIGVDFEGSQSIVSNNSCLDTQVTPTQNYGIAEYIVGGPAMTRIDYANNKIQGFVTNKQILTSGQRSYKGEQVYETAACNIPSLNAGQSHEEIILMPGVRLGDKPGWGCSFDTRGYSIMPHALTDNVVLTVTNVTSGVKAAPVGQSWTVWAEKAINSSGY